MARKLLLFLCMHFYGFAVNLALAQRTIDFSTALELARENNPDWRAAEQDVRIARGRLTTARLISPFNPVLEGQSGRRTIPGEGKGTDYGVGLSMEIEVAGQKGSRMTEAERNLQRAEASFSDFARTFTAKLARAFYDAIFARERSALLRGIESLNNRVLEVTRTKFEAGDVSGLEVNVATVRYAQSRKEALDAERNLSQAILELRRLIGVEESVSPTGNLGMAATPLPIGDALQRALTNRPDLIATRYELQRAEAEIALVKRRFIRTPRSAFSSIAKDQEKNRSRAGSPYRCRFSIAGRESWKAWKREGYRPARNFRHWKKKFGKKWNRPSASGKRRARTLISSSVR